MSLSKNIRSKRRALDITQKQLSEKAGVHYNAISAYERGHREPSLHALIAIANELNVSIDWLLDRQETANN